MHDSILIYVALACFIFSVPAALWRGDPGRWPYAIALIGGGLFFATLALISRK